MCGGIKEKIMTVPSYLMALGVAAGVSLFGSHAVFAESKTDTTNQQPQTVKVQSGDTLSSIAEAHGTDYVRLFNANDFIANPDAIDVNQEIRIPKADEQLPDRFGNYQSAAQVAAVAAPVATATAPAATTYSAPAASAPAAPVYAQSSAGNTYAYGWCTWYVKSRKPNIPNTWGNAYAWVGSAQASGYATGSVPVAGAIGASGGHVVYVESTDGANVSISEMAYAGGIGVVHYRTVPASSFYYIYA